MLAVVDEQYDRIDMNHPSTQIVESTLLSFWSSSHSKSRSRHIWFFRVALEAPIMLRSVSRHTMRRVPDQKSRVHR